jgi:hypothetical protein
MPAITRVNIKEINAGEYRGIIATPAGEYHELAAATWEQAATRIREFLTRNNLSITEQQQARNQAPAV